MGRSCTVQRHNKIMCQRDNKSSLLLSLSIFIPLVSSSFLNIPVIQSPKARINIESTKPILPNVNSFQHQTHQPKLLSLFASLQQEQQENNDNKENVGEKIEFNNLAPRLPDQKFLERNKHWVVIADDEEDIRMAVGDYLYDVGYQVTACEDADALLEVCTTTKYNQEYKLPEIPHAIVTDIRMPGKNGLTLLKLIRQNERLQRVPVVVLSAMGLTPDRIDGYKAGADVYISKPFDPEELVSIIDNVILRRKQMIGSQQKSDLVIMKQEMAQIKHLMNRNANKMVKNSNVYLTMAERQVLELLCQGYTNAEIAKHRDSGGMRVAQIVQKLFQLTNTQTRTELLRWAMETGYVPMSRK